MAKISVSQNIVCPHCKKDDGIDITGMYLDTLFCECKHCGCSFPEQHLTKHTLGAACVHPRKFRMPSGNLYCPDCDDYC